MSLTCLLVVNIWSFTEGMSVKISCRSSVQLFALKKCSIRSYKYMLCNFLLRLSVKHEEIQTTVTAMDAYASRDSDKQPCIFENVPCES